MFLPQGNTFMYVYVVLLSYWTDSLTKKTTDRPLLCREIQNLAKYLKNNNFKFFFSKKNFDCVV